MRIVFMLAAMAAVAGPALAQPAATIAVEGGVSHRMNWRFDGCDECPALTREFGGEVAFLATDSLAVLGGVGLTFYDTDRAAAVSFRLHHRTRSGSQGAHCQYRVAVLRATR